MGGAAKPLVVFREVERGWQSGTPKPFGRYFGKGRVRLDFGEGGPRGGFYTRSQAYYLVADFLRRYETVKIEQVTTSAEDKDGARPYALWKLVCRNRNGVTMHERIFMSLSWEDGSWAIAEIRVVPAD
jgi:hypothetical protein